MAEDIPIAESLAVILARMEVKLDHALERGADHEARLRSLERKVWGASGVAAVLAGGGATLLNRIIGS